MRGEDIVADYKQGELEAKHILEQLGYVFDETYHDENTKKGMPDFRFKDGRYLEITHTCHNNNIVKEPNEFAKKSTEDQYKIMIKAKKAYERIKNKDYEQIEKCLTEKGKKDLKRDRSIVKNHYGLDVCNNKTSEFNCDLPIICHSIDNIVDAIRKKTEKHPDGNTDLFVFVTPEECNYLCHLLQTGSANGFCQYFDRSILLSSFDVVFICEWNFESQTYNTENPKMIIFHKMDNDKLKISPRNN